MLKMDKLTGLATGVGSLPHKDADAALDLIFKYLPQIPFWPQLPKISPREGMVAQFSENFPCIELTDDGALYRALDRENQLEKFYEKVIENDVDYFKITPNCSQGIHAFSRRLRKQGLKNIEFIKCHISGPFTFAASIKDELDVLLLYDPVFLQVVIKALVMKALWQVKFLKEFGKKIILFIDEPYLACFGSAYAPITREQVVAGLKEITQGVRSENTLVGVHCCGNTDWSIFTDIDSIDIINFDAFGFLDKLVLYADSLKGFLIRGGVICWGIVPTNEFSGSETAESLAAKIKEGIDTLSKKGVDRDLLSERLLVSPSCGLGTLDSAKAEKILQLLSEVSSQFRGHIT